MKLHGVRESFLAENKIRAKLATYVAVRTNLWKLIRNWLAAESDGAGPIIDKAKKTGSKVWEWREQVGRTIRKVRSIFCGARARRLARFPQAAVSLPPASQFQEWLNRLSSFC